MHHARFWSSASRRRPHKRDRDDMPNADSKRTSDAILEHEHTPEAIGERLAAGTRQNYLRDFVYGGIDGSVTTFAIVAGTIGASLSIEVVLILGIANLVADGFSMAASNFLGYTCRTRRSAAVIRYRSAAYQH